MVGIRGVALTAVARAARLSFSPASLFAASEPGIWYDPSDFSTMFQDAAGTTPVTAVEQPVGLILDKSKGLVLGPELVTNGDFSNGTTGWTAGAAGSAVTLSVVNQRLRLTKTNTASFGDAVQQVTGLTATKHYRIAVNGYVGTAQVRFLLGSAPENGDVYNGVQSATDIAPVFYVTGRTSFWITVLAYGGNATYAEFDNISVRELPGNHATQTTSTSRPVLSARYNLLTKTEQFDDAAWTKGSITVSANSVTAPDGTTTADTLTEQSGPKSRFGVFFTNTPTPSSSHTFSVAVKNFSGTRFARIVLNTSISTVFACVDVNPQTGTIAQTLNSGLSGIASSSTDLGNGWHRVSITAIGAVNYVTVALITGSTVPAGTDFGYQAYTGDGTSGIYIWGASLVPANQASLPYQRVNTATDYDADPSKFKPYLRFDGIDDWLVTPTITPGTDKAQVFAGVRKLSDAAVFVLAELSLNSDSNIGAWRIDSTGNYRAQVGDVSARKLYEINGAAAPATNVLSVSASFAGGGFLSIRDNGTLPVNNVAINNTLPAINFGNYPLYIGRRGGTSLPFNGHLYGLIVRFGANLPAATIASTETWLNQRTGAY